MAETTGMNDIERLVFLAGFSKKLGVLFNSGVSVVRALSICEAESLDPMKAAIRNVAASIQEGNTIVDAMAAWPDVFPSYYRLIIGRGEELGNLDFLLGVLAQMLDFVVAGRRRGIHESDATLDASVGVLWFTRQLADLSLHMYWMRALRILEHEAPSPFDEVAIQLVAAPREDEGKQWLMLTDRMGRRPDLFSSFYRAFVAAGQEYGSIDKDILTHLLGLLEEDWKFSRLVGWPEGRVSTIIDLGRPIPQDWLELTSEQQTLTLLLFCRTLSILSSYGTGPAKMLRVVAHLFPTIQRDAVLEVAQKDLADGMTASLHEIGLLPGFITSIMHACEISGRIDYAMNEAAEAYRYELEVRLR